MAFHLYIVEVDCYEWLDKCTVQITHNFNGTRVSHACDMRGVNYTHVGFLDSTRVYMHMQYLHTRMF